MKKHIFFALIFGLFFAACSTHSNTLSQNTTYKILSISLNDILLESPPNATFNIDDKIYGNTGCNNYFVSFQWIDKNIIEISDNGGATKMMCDPNANEFERMFLQNFVGKFNITSTSDSAILDNGNLTINLKK